MEQKDVRDYARWASRALALLEAGWGPFVEGGKHRGSSQGAPGEVQGLHLAAAGENMGVVLEMAPVEAGPVLAHLPG